MIDNNVVALNQNNTEIVGFSGGGSVVEMQRNLTEMKAKIDIVQQFIKGVMKDGLDYGSIPGTDNRSLFQPGADKLNFLYGYARHIAAKDEVKNIQTGHYDVTVRIQLRHKDTGVIVGEGEGSCSTMESKYRYRWVFESDVPESLNKETLVCKTFTSKKNGKSYKKYRIENADLCDVWNTILKMAIKRAYVGATLAATGLSGIFQMDEEDFDTWIDGEKEKFEKQHSTPKASDEHATFQPPTSNGGRVTEKQLAKIFGDAKRKGLSEEAIRDIVQYVKKKPINELTTQEASAVIDFIAKTSEEDLQDLIMSASIPAGE